MSFADSFSDEPALRDWDPNLDERSWYRSAMTGDLGYMVRRDGKDMIRIDRPGMEMLRKMDPGEWKPEHEHRPLTSAAAAQIAFAADVRLSLALGDYKASKRKWEDLSDRDRHDFVLSGPRKGAERKRLFQAIMENLRPLTSDV